MFIDGKQQKYCNLGGHVTWWDIEVIACIMVGPWHVHLYYRHIAILCKVHNDVYQIISLFRETHLMDNVFSLNLYCQLYINGKCIFLNWPIIPGDQAIGIFI